jgi:1-aminocyclopropane-1-carboxylate deaminase/D-cysteine desulfhydrase-like pyridoxal-dependent ACC family enzyme
MPVNYNAAVKTARITATRDHFANGTLEIQDAGDTPLAVFGLVANGGSISGDSWTLSFDADTVAAVATGTAAKAVVKTSGGSAHITGLTVGESGADVIIDNTDINTGQDVTMNSASIQHAA